MLTKRAIARVEHGMQTVCGVDVVPGSVLDRVLGAIAGVSIGDRLGLPAETMTHEAIMVRTGGNGIDRYYDANEWRTDATAWGPFGPTGSASDDLACTLALMDAVANNGGIYDPERSAEALLKAAKETEMAGWGGSMKYGAKRLEAGRWEGDGRLTTVRSWMARPPGAPGTGDGVMMRVSPLGAMLLMSAAPDYPGMIMRVLEEARLTHGHPVAAIGAAVVAIAIANAPHAERGLSVLRSFSALALGAVQSAITAHVCNPAAFDGEFSSCLKAWGDGWGTWRSTTCAGPSRTYRTSRAPISRPVARRRSPRSRGWGRTPCRRRRSRSRWRSVTFRPSRRCSRRSTPAATPTRSPPS